MALDRKNPPTEEELIKLMLEEPYLIRRPAIRIAGTTVFGFDRGRLDALGRAGG